MTVEAALQRLRDLQPGCSFYCVRAHDYLRIEAHHEQAGGWRISTVSGDSQTGPSGLTLAEAARRLRALAQGGRLLERRGAWLRAEANGNQL